jgi:hypothetical protein
MVAAVMDRVARAFEHRQRIQQHRHAMLADAPLGAPEAVLAAGREGDRGGLLAGLEHVDREMLGASPAAPRSPPPWRRRPAASGGSRLSEVKLLAVSPTGRRLRRRGRSPPSPRSRSVQPSASRSVRGSLPVRYSRSRLPVSRHHPANPRQDLHLAILARQPEFDRVPVEPRDDVAEPARDAWTPSRPIACISRATGDAPAAAHGRKCRGSSRALPDNRGCRPPG